MTGYECYVLYHSLKLHFTQESYDFFKYRGKSRINVDSFEKRKDKYYFHKLSRKYNHDEFIDFLVSNFVRNHKTWVGNLLEETADDVYKQYLKIHQSLGYICKNEWESIFSQVKNPNELIVTDGQYPILLSKTFRGEIHVESLIILNDLLNFFPMWNRKIQDDVRWPDFRITCLKYKPFIQYDNVTFMRHLKNVINTKS